MRPHADAAGSRRVVRGSTVDGHHNGGPRRELAPRVHPDLQRSGIDAVAPDVWHPGRRWIEHLQLGREDRALLAGPDATAPTTTVSAIMGRPGDHGFYTSPVTIDLSATDPDDDPSSLTTRFRVNGAPFAAGNPITLADDGIYTSSTSRPTRPATSSRRIR